jgi:transposase IS116/IS110/IS902 family protein
MAQLLAHQHDAVQRLAEVPGLGADSAQQIIAEVGTTAATFPSAKHLASWIGACPGNEESAGVNYSHRCPKANRQMRRLLNQAANAAVKAKDIIFAIVYRRLVPRLGHGQANRRHRPPALSLDLEDSSPRDSVVIEQDVCEFVEARLVRHRVDGIDRSRAYPRQLPFVWSNEISVTSSVASARCAPHVGVAGAGTGSPSVCASTNQFRR